MSWIPVEERMPEPGRDVLFYDSEFDEVELGHVLPAQRGTGWLPSYADGLVKFENVTHWMEKPREPKPKKIWPALC